MTTMRAFTVTEDDAIRTLRADGANWERIGAALDRQPNVVRRRGLALGCDNAGPATPRHAVRPGASIDLNAGLRSLAE